MGKVVVFVLLALAIVFAAVACAAPPTPTPLPTPVPPTAAPPPTVAPTPVPPTAVPPTAAPTAVPPTAVPPTAVPPTAAPTAVPPTAAPTAVPPTPVPPTATVAPGLYVNSMRLSATQPVFNSTISFYPTFVNTSSVVQTFKWLIYIYRADTPTKSDNETTAVVTGFPPGSGEYPATGGYRYGPTGNTCEYFYAKVAWLDKNNKATFFTTTAGQEFNQGFSICDANKIPSPTAPPPPPTAVIPTPGPGLFVTGIRLQPFDQPHHNTDTTFFVTFSNTTNTVQNFKWKLYVYKADTPAKSNWDAAAAMGSFPVGSGEYEAQPTFRYGPTGNACDYFYAVVGWLDANNKVTLFTDPKGVVFNKGFSVCN